MTNTARDAQLLTEAMILAETNPELEVRFQLSNVALEGVTFGLLLPNGGPQVIW
jgi:hypothetical protein